MHRYVLRPNSPSLTWQKWLLICSFFAQMLPFYKVLSAWKTMQEPWKIFKKARIWQKGQFSIHISFKNKMRICILVHILYQNAEINFLKALACDEFIRPKCFQSPCPIYPLKFLLESYFKFIHTPLNLFVLKVMTYRLGHASGKK